jgi:hypothetical protein
MNKPQQHRNVAGVLWKINQLENISNINKPTTHRITNP